MTSRRGQLEIQVDVRHVVKRSLIKVEPDNLMCERIFVANSASVETRRNLQICNDQKRIRHNQDKNEKHHDLPR